MSEGFGYVAAALIGMTLGLLGGGGSILTVPMLVYLFRIPPTEATVYSLFIVGLTALIGGAAHLRQGNVDLGGSLLFALPMIAGVYLMRRFIAPALPDPLFAIGGFAIAKERATLILFALLMLAAGVAMVRRNRRAVRDDGHSRSRLLVPQGFATGLVTGAVGAGGGFLIVPALTIAARMPMKRAVATSLIVIAASSGIGFLGDLQAGHPVDWGLLRSIVSLAIAGGAVGAYASRFVPGERLRPVFGYLVLAMGVLILGSELGRV